MANSIYQFAGFRLDCDNFELRRNGASLRVERMPMELLILLVSRQGQLVTREEIARHLWSSEVFVDTEHGTNTAIRKIRYLLRDDPEIPRILQTVKGKGYRIICPVESLNGQQADQASASIVQPAQDIGGKTRATPSHRAALGIAVTAAAVLCAAFAGAWWFIPRAAPVVDSITQLTDDAQPKSNLATDGSRVYFSEGLEGTSNIAEVSIGGGPSVPLQSTPVDFLIKGEARDGSALIGMTTNVMNPYGPLWSIPLPAGEPRRLGNAMVQSADIFPDNRIVYSIGKDVSISENDGSSSRKLASLPGIVQNTVVSPDGRRILLAVDTTSGLTPDIFEIRADGTGLREIHHAGANECCFSWSADGKYLLYSAQADKRWDLWALPLRSGFIGRPDTPVRLTNGPISFAHGGIASRDGKQVFAVGSKERGQLVRYDTKSRQFVPLLSGISATDATYSKDGNWVAYTMFPEHTLWRSRSDGSERMQLTYPPMEVYEPYISPDATKIVFDSMGDHSLCMMDRNGGSLRKISGNAWSPKWSPDGASVVYNRLKADGISDNGMEIAEVNTGKKTEVPSPDGKLGAFWLDEQTLVAANGDLKKLMIFDFRTGAWTDLVAANLQNWINSPDGKYVYYAAGGTEGSIERIRVADRRVETVANLKGFIQVSNFDSPQLRVAADGSPTLTRAVDSREIYALRVNWP